MRDPGRNPNLKGGWHRSRVLNITQHAGDARNVAAQMTSERTQAYGRVMRTLDDVGPTKLHASEQERVREAADTLIFAAAAEEAQAALAEVEALCEHLVATDRWSAERAAELARDVADCGPFAPVA
jgi:hypothetical protein